MLTFKYRKYEDAIFASHIDMLRMTNRTLRRMGIKVEYSKGFNPRQLVNLSQPLPLGITSNAEWATVQTDYNDTEMFLDLYNKFCPKGIKAVACYNTNSKPNIAGKVIASDYLIENINAEKYKVRIEGIANQPFIIKAKTKSGEILRDISSWIYFIEVRAQDIYVMLPFGNTNIRIDNFTDKLNEDFNLGITHKNIVRLNQYMYIEGSYVKVDEYMKVIK